jgi:uncharacterized protein YjbI with pentapeptide repeats
MTKDYSNENLQNKVFANEDLSDVKFIGADLRGVDFTGSDLSGADFTHAKTGITPANTTLIFLVSLALSLFSGYIAMLAGHTVQQMLASKDGHLRTAGIATIVIVILFILYYYWKGGHSVIRNLLLPVLAASLLIAIVIYVSGLGTGMAMLYQILALLLVVIMFIIGTAARAAAGSLSNILFIVVALSGGMFGRSVGGGIGTVVMALSCAQISKRALSGAKGFDTLKKVARFITKKFGTSFRKTKLLNANFSQAKIRNCDFSDADLSLVHWADVKKRNCIDHDAIITEKKAINNKKHKDLIIN